jgi:hypothetical protein
MFPGEKIVVKNNDGTLVEDSGSSFATAIATGLAGLLIYCTLVLRIGSTSSMRRGTLGSRDPTPNYFAWDYELMKRTFGKVSGGSGSVTGRKLSRPEQIVVQFVEQLRGKRPLPEQELDGAAADALRDVLGKLRVSATKSYM